MFNEICIYEAKIDKQDEIEALMKEVAEFLSFTTWCYRCKIHQAHSSARRFQCCKRRQGAASFNQIYRKSNIYFALDS